jgi:FkbH-like protein
MKIGICGNSDLETLAVALDKKIADLDIIVGKPDSFANEMINPADGFRDLDLCIIALNWREFSRESYIYGYADNFEVPIQLFNQHCADLQQYIKQFRTVCSAKIFIFSPQSDISFPTGFLTRLLDKSPFDLFIEHQKSFNVLCRSFTDVYPVDIDEISNQIGRKHLSGFSLKGDSEACVNLFFEAVAEHLFKMITQFYKYPLKCLVLDLDNTLWGGIVGETGMNAILLHESGPGAAFLSFQNEILKLYKQGIILAICSKNNTCDALEVIEQHPKMVIRPQMISCFRINWDDKPKSMLSIAAELNIGLDAIMFIDDNPVERSLMKATLPEIEVLELPADPECYVQTLKDSYRFWPVQLTKDDTQKKNYFSLDQLRKSSRDMTKSITEFLRSSQIKIKIKKADPSTLPRIAQLFNKTNQFNLTTIRYSETQLESFTKNSTSHLFCMEMTDRFGDYGVIASALLRDNTIDSFLLSCRAFGKQAETALLLYILQFLKSQDHKKVYGNYVPSHKNNMTKDFFKNTGFTLLKKNNAESVWEFNLSQNIAAIPDWFELV